MLQEKIEKKRGGKRKNVKERREWSRRK
jgi:hypothetical protein